MVGVGVADGALLEVERVEVERAAAVRRGQQPAGPAGRLGGVHGGDVGGADDLQRRPDLLDDARERHLERGGDRPQRLDARVALAGLELRERRLAEAGRVRPARRASCPPACEGRGRSPRPPARTCRPTLVPFRWTKLHLDGYQFHHHGSEHHYDGHSSSPARALLLRRRRSRDGADRHRRGGVRRLVRDPRPRRRHGRRGADRDVAHHLRRLGAVRGRLGARLGRRGGGGDRRRGAAQPALPGDRRLDRARAARIGAAPGGRGAAGGRRVVGGRPARRPRRPRPAARRRVRADGVVVRRHRPGHARRERARRSGRLRARRDVPGALPRAAGRPARRPPRAGGGAGGRRDRGRADAGRPAGPADRRRRAGRRHRAGGPREDRS